jgi:formate dehydrogenase subunit gamma
VSDRRITRFGFGERLVHLLTAISYVYLLLTGLALWTPAMYWIAIVLGGGFLSRLLHPWVGVFYALVVLRMFLMWRADMKATEADRRWRKAVMHYIRNEDDHVPPAGRFNFGQKQLFWVMVWAALALLVSGAVLWFPASVPVSQRWIRDVAVVVHAVSALVTIAAFIVHIYMGVFVVPAGLHAIVHGDVTEEWARAHHRLWFEARTGRHRDRNPRSNSIGGS